MSERMYDKFESLLIGARLALCPADDNNGFYSSNGNKIEKHFSSENARDLTVAKQEKPTIHQLYHVDNVIFFAAERTFGLVETVGRRRKQIVQLAEWLSAFRVLRRVDSHSSVASADDREFEVALLFGSNLLRIVCVSLAADKPYDQCDDVQLQPRCQLTSARFEELTPSSWAVVSCSAFGDVHVYRIARDQTPTTVCSVNWGQGPIFDTRLRRTTSGHHELYTVGDDRSLRVWEMSELDDPSNRPSTSTTNDSDAYGSAESDHSNQPASCSRDDINATVNYGRWRPLATVYGHGARVFCVRLAPSDRAGGYRNECGDCFTGGEDSAVCIWKWIQSRDTVATDGDRRLQLLQRVVLGQPAFGGVRAALLLDDGRRMIVSSESGALKSIALQPYTSRQMTVPEAKCRLLNFRFSDDSRTLYFIDDKKTLYRCSLAADEDTVKSGTVAVKRTKILRDDSLKFELLETFRHGAVTATKDSLLFIGTNSQDAPAPFRLASIPISLVRVVTATDAGDELTLASLLDGTCHLLAVSAAGLMERVSWRLKARAVVLCAVLVGRRVVLGTRNGHIIVMSLDDNEATIGQIVAGAHCGKPIKAIYRRSDEIISLGRDGQIRYWTMSEDGQLNASSADRCGMDIPCEARFLVGKPFVGGFSADEFVVFDAKERCALARYNCAGGKRAWQIVRQTADEIRFAFLAQGQLKIVQINLFAINTITNVFNASHTNCVRVLAAGEDWPDDEHVALAAGDDGTVSAFQLSESLSEYRPLFRGPTHVSSVFDLDSVRRPDGVDIVAAVGGRAEISIFSRHNDGRLAIHYTGRLPTLGRNEGDTRLIAVRLRHEAESSSAGGYLKIYVLASDGTLRRLTFDLSSNRLTAGHSNAIPNSLTMFWRLEMAGGLLYTISTCGRLFCYSEQRVGLTSESFVCLAEQTVERCGLSALAVASDPSGDNLIFIGADSGRVSVWRHKVSDGIFAAAPPIDVHYATVTGIQIVRDPERSWYRLFTVSTDCRVGFLRFDARTETLSLLDQTTLAIHDPAAITLADPDGWVCLVVGDGAETVQWPTLC